VEKFWCGTERAERIAGLSCPNRFNKRSGGTSINFAERMKKICTKAPGEFCRMR